MTREQENTQLHEGDQITEIRKTSVFVEGFCRNFISTRNWELSVFRALIHDQQTIFLRQDQLPEETVGYFWFPTYTWSVYIFVLEFYLASLYIASNVENRSSCGHFFWSFLYKIHFWLMLPDFKILAFFWRQLWPLNGAIVLNSSSLLSWNVGLGFGKWVDRHVDLSGQYTIFEYIRSSMFQAKRSFLSKKNAAL